MCWFIIKLCEKTREKYERMWPRSVERAGHAHEVGRPKDRLLEVIKRSVKKGPRMDDAESFLKDHFHKNNHLTMAKTQLISVWGSQIT